MSHTFHPAAELEFLESVGYYESKIQELGQALITEFTALVSLIFESPEAWQGEAKTGIRVTKVFGQSELTCCHI